VELRGHGESTAEARFTLWDLADDWAAILDQEGIDSAVCGGLSTGGMTGMRFALRYPGRTRGLILIDTNAYKERLFNGLQYNLLGTLYRHLGLIPTGVLAMKMFGADTRAHHPERMEHFIQTLKQQDRRQLSRAMNAVFNRESVDLRALEAPAFVAVGEDDGAFPPEVAQATASQLPDAEFHVISNAGHLSAVEQPKALADLLQAFLSRHAG
jgi:pimeloyl-ACP methyl ester carboxylesterase